MKFEKKRIRKIILHKGNVEPMELVYVFLEISIYVYVDVRNALDQC